MYCCCTSCWKNVCEAASKNRFGPADTIPVMGSMTMGMGKGMGMGMELVTGMGMGMVMVMGISVGPVELGGDHHIISGRGSVKGGDSTNRCDG
jgi:hypothetical protein